MWTPRAGSFVNSNLLLPDTDETSDLFDNYPGMLLELDANPMAIAVREVKSFTAFTGYNNARIKALGDLDHEDDVSEVGWLPNGELCYVARDGDPDVGTGVLTEVMTYGKNYKIMGPYVLQHELVWDVFLGLISGRDVVLRLEDEPHRILCSPLLPIVYVGLNALDVNYDPRQIHPVDILALGWSRLLLMVDGAIKTNLPDILPFISSKTCEMLVNTLIQKHEEDLVDLTDLEKESEEYNEMYGGVVA